MINSSVFYTRLLDAKTTNTSSMATMPTICHVLMPSSAATPAAAPPIQAGHPCRRMAKNDGRQGS